MAIWYSLSKGVRVECSASKTLRFDRASTVSNWWIISIFLMNTLKTKGYSPWLANLRLYLFWKGWRLITGGLIYSIIQIIWIYQALLTGGGGGALFEVVPKRAGFPMRDLLTGGGRGGLCLIIWEVGSLYYFFSSFNSWFFPKFSSWKAALAYSCCLYSTCSEVSKGGWENASSFGKLAIFYSWWKVGAETSILLTSKD